MIVMIGKVQSEYMAFGPFHALLVLRHREAQRRMQAAELSVALLPPQPQPSIRPLESHSTPGTIGSQRQRKIIAAVAEKHGQTYWDMIGPKRSAPIARARQECFFRLREEAKLSWSEIGRLLGNRDHTTAWWGYRKHKNRTNAD
jgi:DnaA-like protein